MSNNIKHQPLQFKNTFYIFLKDNYQFVLIFYFFLYCRATLLSDKTSRLDVVKLRLAKFKQKKQSDIVKSAQTLFNRGQTQTNVAGQTSSLTTPQWQNFMALRRTKETETTNAIVATAVGCLSH